MKKVLLLTAMSAVLFSCTNNANRTNEPVRDQTEVVDKHTAKNSLDYKGTYKGVLPCADCDSTVVSLKIEDGKYERTSISYKNGKETKIEEKGNFVWNDKEDVIILDGVKDSPNKYFVSENQMTQLDMSGEKITGDLKDMYILKK